MFVTVQFPIADARRFLDGPHTYLRRPNWKAPLAGVVSEYVWGFGRVAYRELEVDPAWSDEAYFALAAGSIRLPELKRRQVQLVPGAIPAIVACRFRRLFHDGTCVARVEVGFSIRPGIAAMESLDAEAAVSYLLALPSIVPEAAGAARPRQLAFQGSRLAGRYRDASMPRSMRGVPSLVAAGNPIVLVDSTGSKSATLPKRLEDASAATSGRISLGFALTRFGGTGVPTWYIGPNTAAGTNWDMCRKLRLCLLRLHAEEEVLDRVVSWVDDGSLPYVVGSDAADRLDAYINQATQLLERRLNYGLPSSAIRDAYDAVTEVNRNDVTARRRVAFDGMRLQVRRKAELFIARRDAARPIINMVKVEVEGDIVNEKIHIGGAVTGSIIGRNNKQIITNSFNQFATAHGKEDDLAAQMQILKDSIASLVTELQSQDPNAAADVTDTFQAFAEESTQETPRAGLMRSLGKTLIESAKRVAKIAAPVANAVAAVITIFGIPPL
jgi:hypothetical protein